MAEGAEFSDSLLSVVEGAQRLDRVPIIKHAWRLGRWAVAGYSEPGFRYAPYTTASCINEDAKFYELQASANAGPIPRLWSEIALLSINAGALALAEESLIADGVQAHHAIAYRQRAGAPVHVGILSGEPYEGFGCIERPGNLSARGVGMRQGGDPTEAALGFWLPDGNAFVAPAGMETPLELLPKQYFTKAYSQLLIV